MTTDLTLRVAVETTNQKTERVEPPHAHPATLFVGGRIITGYMIPAWQMMEEFGRQPQDADGDATEGPYASLVEDLKELEVKRAEIEKKEDWSVEDQDFLEDSEPQFVNLARAQWDMPSGSFEPATGTLMRVKIDSVDAWVPAFITAVRNDRL